MKYITPIYEKAIVETEDILTVSGYTVETKEDGSGSVEIMFSKLFG